MDVIAITNVIDKYQLRVSAVKNKLMELLKLLDMRHSNQISSIKFKRAVHLADIKMNEEELDLLATEYRDEDNPDMVRYMDFLTACEEGFDLSQDKNQFMAEALNEAEMIMKNDAISEIKRILGIRKSTLRDLFRDLDDDLEGAVEEGFFVNVIQTNFTLPDDQIEALTRYYMSSTIGKTTKLGGQCMVDYLSLHNDVHNDRLTLRRAPSARKRRMKGRSHAISKMESRMGKQLIEHRLDLREYFTHDPRKTGECDPHQFGQAMARCFKNAAFSQKELDKIMDRYFNKTRTKVRYREFLNRIDLVLGVLLEEEENQVIIPHIHSPIKRPPNSTTADLFDNEEDGRPQSPSYLPEDEYTELERVLHDIRMKMFLKRMNLKPVLRDFDSRGEFHITTAQFLRVLSMFDILPTANADQELLIEKYAPGDLKRPKGEFIHYRKFLADMENVMSTDMLTTFVSLPNQTIRTREVVPFPSEKKAAPKDLFIGVPSRSIQHVWSVLIRDFDDNRYMLENAFRDQDTFNHGSISRAKFGRAITTCGYRMGYSELTTLCEMYQDDSKQDSLYRPYVFWINFYNELLSKAEGFF